jgi:hypothetical protein
MVKSSKQRSDIIVDNVHYRLSSIEEFRCIKPRAERHLQGLKFTRDPSAIEREFKDAERTGTPRPM